MESLYWVITWNCTQACQHCYNNSKPNAVSLSIEDALKIVGNLPNQPPRWTILSGGEVLTNKQLLYATLDALYCKWGENAYLKIQTNGDLLDEITLEKLNEHHLNGIDIASQDAFHRNKQSKKELERLIRDAGYRKRTKADVVLKNYLFMLPGINPKTYDVWGMTPDIWLGGVWPRGRALRHPEIVAKGGYRFCDKWSGAKHFMDDNHVMQEAKIQLNYVFPCCPTTKVPLGDVRYEKLTDILNKCRGNPVFEALNRGKPEEMGEHLGISREEAMKVIDKGCDCDWCDHFFTKHYKGDTLSDEFKKIV